MADSDRELVIPLKIDRTAARQQLAAHEAESRQSIDRTTAHETQSFEKRLEAAKKVDEKRKADAAKTAESIKSLEDQYILKDYERRVNAEQRKQQLAAQTAQRLIQEEQKLLAVQEAAGRKLREESTLSYRASQALSGGLMNVATSMAGIGAVTGVMTTVVGVINQGREKAAQLAQEFLASRDALRALASATGQPASGKLAVDTAVFGGKTGLGAEKSRQFLEPFESAAGGVKGQNLSEAEYGKFREYAGTLTQAKGLDATTAGEIMGGVLKSENFQAKGQGGLEAAARAQQAIGILETGKGRIAALAPQMQKMMGFVSENKLESRFNNASEAAALVSTMAEGKPEEAAVHALHGTRGLFDFGNKEKAGFFKQAGITPQMSAIEAFRASNRVIGSEVEKGVTVQDALAKFGFTDVREKEALETAYIARDKAFEPQAAKAAAPVDTAGTEQVMAGYQASQPGMMAQQKGAGEAIGAVKGSEEAGFAVQKQAAHNKLAAAGRFYGMERVGWDLATLHGMLGNPEEMMTEAEVSRMQGSGLTRNPFFAAPAMWGDMGGLRSNAIGAAQNEPLPADTVQAVKNFTAALNKQTMSSNAPPALPGQPPQMGR